MAAQYTIRLNLGGNLVSQLAAAEASMSRLNRHAATFNRRAGGGAMVYRERYAQTRAAQPMAPSVVANSRRLAESNVAWNSYRRNFLPNMLYPAGIMRNITGLGHALGSLGKTAAAAVPALGAVGSALGAIVGVPLAIKGANTLLGGGIYSIGSKMLNSQSMTGAISNLMQFSMAEKGLGGEYKKAFENATRMAAEYGYSRAGITSTINTLSGFEVSPGKALGTETATDLARIIGKVSQIGARPYDIVALNMQQLLAASKPNMRDIRELLHAAPILSKYALKEMAKMGKSGDPREWLKDRANMINALYQLDRDIQPPAVAKARGRVALAKENSWMEFAGFDRFWDDIAWAGERFWGKISGVSKDWYGKYDSGQMRTTLSEFTDNMAGLLSIGLKLLPKLQEFLNSFVEKYDLRTEGEPLNKYEAPIFDRVNAIAQKQFEDRLLFSGSYDRYLERLSPEDRKRIQSLLPSFIDSLADDIKKSLRIEEFPATYVYSAGSFVKSPNIPIDDKKGVVGMYTDPKDMVTRRFSYNAWFPESFYWDRLDSMLGSSDKKVPPVVPTSDEIEKLTKGSRALIINFNGPIVEMPTKIENAENPTGLMDRIRQEIEDAMTRGLSVAINNATSMT